MPLEFPTIAERALALWLASPRTVSVGMIAERMGAQRMPESISGPGIIEYVFDDDTSIKISGRGKAHKIWTDLP